MQTIARLFALCLVATPTASLAASSDWYETEGARIRLLTTGAPDAQGRLAGALQIELEPGWKTYWRDPGSSGVPPSIDVKATPALAGAIISFPAPEWHDDASGVWAGYDEPVVLPIDFELRGTAPLDKLDAAVFLGVCQSICVPVQARLSLDPQGGAGDAADAAVVSQAHAALPKPATKDLGATIESATAKQIVVRVDGAGTAAANLFIAGENGYLFGPPKPVAGAAGTLFEANVLTHPKARPQGPGIAYTLTTSKGAVSGFLPFF